MSAVSRDEWQQLAGEYALGVLDGEELARARALLAADPEFRAEVGRWYGRLAPLLDEIAPAAPRDEVWRAVEARLGAEEPAGGNVRYLRRRVNVWRGAAAGASALAASLALVLVTRPPQVTPPVQTSAPAPAPAPLVAMLGGEDPAARLLATWNPAERRLVIAAADALRVGDDRTRELWVIPADGTPRSLGVLRGRPREQVAPGADVSAHLQRGATLAISVEPSGGSPTGLPTGPVVASGQLEPV